MEFLALIIEPDEDLRRLVREALREDGWRVVEACSADEALAVICRQPTYPLVYCADNLWKVGAESIDGSSIPDTLRKYLGATVYVVITGAEDNSTGALEAILTGASDYIRRPYLADDVRKPARMVKQRLLAACRENARPALSICPNAVETSAPELSLVGAPEAIVSVFKVIAQSLTPHHSSGSSNGFEKDNRKRSPTYFITGETGTGKELVAHLIHRRSGYAGGAFVPINCSVLPSDLAESELFGHEQGAFTGAIREKKGLWEVADGGTLFLDEITEAPRAVLPKLLRVLQDKTIKRLGSNRLIPVDAQVIAASNRDLRAEIRAGRFREDLYHRLSLFQLHLPPLRERREDIPLLVTHFARRYAARPVKFSRDALELLTEHPWPGNVRELENVIRTAVSHAADGMVYAVDLLPRLQTNLEINLPLSAQVKEFKLKTVKEALRQHRGNVTHTAAALGMTRPTLYKLLKELKAED
jgi:two-component system, NtrC family, response regulator AtoC